MAGKTPRPPAREVRVLVPLLSHCPECQHPLWVGYHQHRQVATLEGVIGLSVHVHHCPNRGCERYHRAYRPEEEGRIVLPHYEHGLDVLALLGALRYQHHETVIEIHRDLIERGVSIGQRNVTYWLSRYDELVALRLSETPERRERLQAQGRLILAIDGLQPDVGHEVLWVIREGLSREVLLARSLLSSAERELTPLLREAVAGLEVPVVGAVSDGQHSIRNAVAEAFPGQPHPLCHFHYLRQAAGPIWEADRHAKKELKKRVRGIRSAQAGRRGARGRGGRDRPGLLCASRAAL